MHLARALYIGLIAATLAACSGGAGGYTPSGSGAGAQNGPMMPSAAVQARAGSNYTISDWHYHVMLPRTHPKSSSAAPNSLQYPDDLTNFGGPVMKSEANHNIYVNCPAKNQTCWGEPEGFQMKFAGSTFAGMIKQYTGGAASGYTFAEGTAVTYPVNKGTALYENDLFQILHQVASSLKKTGYTNEYHIFLPKGTDTCFDFTNQCYSPDYAPTAAFCAYHGSVRFSDIGTVIYSVEPYQDIKGCLTPKSKGASELTNSTISTLAHETFESITDPGPKLAWYNFAAGEIGDECQFFVQDVILGGTDYKSQPMYSNKYHACAISP